MCLFCRIVKKEIPARIVFEDDDLLAFHDINPAAPTHVLVIPKRHIASISEAEPGDVEVLGKMTIAARKIAEQAGIDKTGFRTVINNGPQANQTVLHIHMHVIGGRPMAWPPG
jgi:histidine triad (HIT) family protein